MKLLIVTCIKEHTDIVKSLFGEAGIIIFSVSETTGFKDGRPLSLSDNWFGKTGQQYESVVFFSFAEEANATHALTLVNDHNREVQSDYPLHAFILPVESSSI